MFFFRNKNKKLSNPRIQLNSFLSNLYIDADSILEIGIGKNKNIYTKNLKNWSVKNYKSMDIDSRFKPDFICDLNKDFFSKYNFNEKFDIVFALEVMEYVYDPMQAIKNIYNCLNSDGLSFISFHFIYPIHNPIKYDYLRFTPEGVKKIANECGFKDIKIYPRKAKEGKRSLKKFFKKERMQAEFRLEQTYDIGFIAKLIK